MPEAPLPSCCDLEPALVPPQVARAHRLGGRPRPDASETVPLHRAAARVLAEAIVAPRGGLTIAQQRWVPPGGLRRGMGA